MTPQQQAAELRSRAKHLRSQARTLDGITLDRVRMRCSTDTWVGPLADAMSAAVGDSIRDLDAAVGGIRDAATRLEMRARVADAAAAAATPGAPR